jgi:hypothetical protein
MKEIKLWCEVYLKSVLNNLKIIEGDYIYLYFFGDLVKGSFHNMTHCLKNLIEHLPKVDIMDEKWMAMKKNFIHCE